VNLAYIAPLERAWARMKVLLFRPVQPGIWLLLGLAAFLGGEQYWRSSFGARIPGRAEVDRWRESLSDPTFVAFMAAFGPLILVLAIFFTWVFSRGAFVFLDDVVRSRAEIADPWRRFHRQGNSLFLWKLGFGLFTLLVWAATLGPFAMALWSLDPGQTVPWSLIAPLVAVIVVVGLLLAFVDVLLKHFVVPLMWAHDLRTLQAWRRLFPLLRGRPGAFVLYGLFVLILGLLAVVAILVFGLGTLCTGFCALVIPVIGAAVLLPITIPLRSLGPEFLSQFGPEVFPPLPAPREIDPDAGRPMPVIPPVAPPPWGGPGAPPDSSS